MKLIYTVKEIKYLNEYFKNNSDKEVEQFFTSEILELIQRTPAMYKGFISSYKNQKNLQPGYLTEINIGATIASLMNAIYDENISEDNVRHQYSNENCIIKQYGGCNTSDMQLFFKTGEVKTIEFKEPLALGGDYDLGITEEGKLYPKIKQSRKFPRAAQVILDEFNKNESLFDYLGHNIKLTEGTYLQAIMEDYIKEKNIDYIASYNEKTNELIYFHSSEIYNHVSYEGSEIRTAGKNSVKVYTPIAFKRALEEKGCFIQQNIVAIPKNVALGNARGSNGKLSRIKINSIFYFPYEELLKEDKEYYYVNLNKAKQLKQGISVHLNLH